MFHMGRQRMLSIQLGYAAPWLMALTSQHVKSARSAAKKLSTSLHFSGLCEGNLSIDIFRTWRFHLLPRRTDTSPFIQEPPAVISSFGTTESCRSPPWATISGRDLRSRQRLDQYQQAIDEYRSRSTAQSPEGTTSSFLPRSRAQVVITSTLGTANNRTVSAPLVLRFPLLVVHDGEVQDEEHWQHWMEAAEPSTEVRTRAASKATIDALSRLLYKEVDKAEKEESCVICCSDFDVVGEVVSMPCGHIFCPSCLTEWLKSAHTCPTCRYALPQEDQDNQSGDQEADGASVAGLQARQSRQEVLEALVQQLGDLQARLAVMETNMDSMQAVMVGLQEEIEARDGAIDADAGSERAALY